MIKRHAHLLNKFSRNLSEAKLVNQLSRSRKAVEVNAGGTSGYTIKKGQNPGKLLEHLTTDPKTI